MASTSGEAEEYAYDSSDITGSEEDLPSNNSKKGSKKKAVDRSQAIVKWAGGEAASTGVSAVMVAAGITTLVAPTVAVIVLVGHVIVRGSIRAVKKKLKVRAEQKAHLEQLNLTETTARSSSGHFTVVLNGVGPNGEFNSFVSPNDDASYGPVSPGHLKGISKLISGATNCNSWVYERFCQTKCGTMTVVVLRSQHSRGKDKLRVAWENSGSLDYTKAQVYTEREWKKTKFAGKTKTMPEGIADVDMALDKTLVFD
ncbi:hypothetical protein Esi_0125_0081 [Ectocarpus siliculosus]|uniref:Uncharacterized protein n=1 Tax=Ectocarpus siliculosus TaxID=2880 RepID=D7FJ27_ECTSI|nr:hypothetical protein Esi_0125_0081 [Ectocarpus siliculosus]|eukprot:CBJ49066.1 hypothetical protein Esi_0125_0081 [Ectocarpus siliculosus]